MPDDFRQRVLSAILSQRANDQFGMKPYQPGYNFPQDVGLGGLSTEYTATDYDPNGQVMNYPQIWFDTQGQANLLTQPDAYARALAYEQSTGQRFPRFNSLGNAETFAQHRSASGGAEFSPLATLFGFRNF